MENASLLDRILTVEQDIAQSLFDVQLKSDNDISQAMSEGDIELKRKCNACILECSEKVSQAKEVAHQEYLKKLKGYEQQLHELSTHKEEFSSLLDGLLFNQ